MVFRYTNARPCHGHTFGELQVGEWFRYDDDEFIKIEETQREPGGRWYNAVELDNGNLVYIFDEDGVEIYKGEVTLDESKFEE